MSIVNLGSDLCIFTMYLGSAWAPTMYGVQLRGTTNPLTRSYTLTYYVFIKLYSLDARS